MRLKSFIRYLSTFLRRAEAQKNKKKQYQKQIPEIDESEKLPEDLLEDADLKFIIFFYQ